MQQERTTSFKLFIKEFVENRQAGEEVQDAMVDAVKQSVDLRH